MKTQTKALWISAGIYFLIILAWYSQVEWLTTAGKFIYAGSELLYVGLYFTIFMTVMYFYKTNEK